MTKFIKAFLSITLAIMTAVAGMTLVANAETITSDTILQKFLVVYNMNETTRVTNAETGATGTYFPVHVYTAIDSLKYKEVGIKVTPKYISTGTSLGTQTMWTTTVYGTMRVTKRDGSEQVYTASQLGGNYLFGRELLFNSNNFDAADTEIEIVPYAIDRNGNEILGKTLVLTDEAIKARDPSSGLFYHDTNVNPCVETTAEERYSVEKGEFSIADYFTAAEGKTIDSSRVKVTISDSNVASYTADTSDWTNGILDFNTLGDVDVTVKAGSGVAKVVHFTVTEFDKFDKKFTNESFIYRVGNSNNVAMSSLFAASGDGTVNSAKVNVTVENVDGDAFGVFTANTSDWTNGNIKFSGTGTVKVTVNEGENIPTELYLEVINAVNTTGIASATANDVVLLNDVTTGSIISVSGGHTIHGNGFTVTWPNDVSCSSYVEGFIQMNSGNLDNVQIKVPDFSFAGMYQYQLLSTQYGNVCDTSRGTSWFFNVRCAVLADGKSSLKNSKVSGGRIAVYARSGDFTFDNSTVIGGAVSSVQIGSADAVTFKDMKLVQKPIPASVHDTSKTIMGFSVLVMAESSGASTPITIEGDFEQYAWICEEYKQYVPNEDTGDSTGIVQGIVTKVLLMDDYKHNVSLEGGEEKTWFSLGIAYMPVDQGNTVSVPTIYDNRNNKADVPYSVATISVASTTARVYTYDNSNGTHDSTLVMPEFVVTNHENILPVLSYSDTSADKTFVTELDSTKGWASTFTVDLDATGDYTFDFSKLTATRNGAEYDYTVTDSNGNAVTAQTLLFDDSGVYEYIITVDDNKAYATDGTLQDNTSDYINYSLTIVATKTSIAPPEKVADPSGTALLVAKAKDDDWSIAVPALEGAQIKYYSKVVGDYKTLSLADIVPTTKGKQNGTENFWTKTVTDDYTLTITSSYIHEGKYIYGMPVVIEDGDAYKMYFTLADTSGYVSTSTASRACTLTYEFTDANGGSVKFTKSWSLDRSTYIDGGGKQYSYDDFVSGSLSEAGGCVTPDTLITLADGTQVRVDSLTGEEELLVWNMETGSLDSAPILFVDSDAEADVNVVALTFSDGTVVDVIYEHGFWDYDLNKYVYLDENASDYIGHTFARQNGDALEKVQLVDVNISTESSMAYSPVTAGHLCYFVNGMLSMPGGIGGLFNFFEVDPETLTYDLEAMERDIAEYGLFTYEEMAELVPELPESMFDAAGGKYLKISIGKGNLTEEELEAMIIRYAKFF